MLLPFEQLADEELTAAVMWYEQERRGQGERFLSEVLQIVDQAARFLASHEADLGLRVSPPSKMSGASSCDVFRTLS